MGNCVPGATRVAAGAGEDDAAGKGDGGHSAGTEPMAADPDSKTKFDKSYEPPTTIAGVLSNVLYSMEFHKYLATSSCSNCYEFIQALDRFKSDFPSPHKAAVVEAKKIYGMHLADDAPLRVPLDEALRAEVKQIIDAEAGVSPRLFSGAQERTLKHMEEKDLPGYINSNFYTDLTARIKGGELTQLMEKDVDAIKDVLFKEFIDFLGDPDLKTVLSTDTGIAWFRKYLVIEFAEEGLDLWVATHKALHAGGGGEGGGGEGPSALRAAGQEIFDRFIKSGCAAESNLPGTVVTKVTKTLENEAATDEDIRKAFDKVELEIFKLLAYDPFLRFKRSGLYVKHCLEAKAIAGAGAGAGAEPVAAAAASGGACADGKCQ